MVASKRTRIRLCILLNVVTLTMVVGLVVGFADKTSTYWKFGPSDDLMIISVKISTWAQYALLMCVILVLKVSTVIVSEIGGPILGFSIYNPDKKRIVDFTKLELQVYANIMWFVSGARGLFMVMVGISQIDVAFFGLVVGEIVSLFTIRMLLNEKEFGPITTFENEELASLI